MITGSQAGVRRKPNTMNDAGLTLVEMVVTFALLGLFMVAAMRVISYTVNIYYAARGVNNTLVVSNMVADKVAGLVGTMKSGTELSLGALGVGSDTEKLPIVKTEDGADALYFVDGTNCPIRVTAKEGRLRVTYFDRQAPASPEAPATYKQVPWYFADDAYMGYEIEDFSLKKAPTGEYPDNVYLLEFTLNSDRYGSHRTRRCIKCYSMPEDAAAP